MSKVQFEIVDDAKSVVFQPSPNRVSHSDENAPPLKRRVPKLPKKKSRHVRTDD